MKGGLNVVSLSLITIGIMLIWCAFTDRNPVDVLKALAKGDYKGIPDSGSWGHPLVIGGGTFPPLPGSNKTSPKKTPPATGGGVVQA